MLIAILSQQLADLILANNISDFKVFVEAHDIDVHQPMGGEEHANYFQRTPIYYAACHGMLDFVKYLIEEKNCDPKLPLIAGPKRSMTPLYAAASHDHFNVVKYLSEEQHCDPNQAIDDGLTPFLHVCGNGSLHLAKYLIEQHGCDPEQPLAYGGSMGTPLVYAAQEGRLDILKYFIEQRGCNPNRPLSGGRFHGVTALRLASLKNQHQVVHYLASLGGNIFQLRNIPDKAFQTWLQPHLHLFQLIKQKQFEEAYIFLQSNDTLCVRATNDDGNTPLHLIMAQADSADDNIKKLVDMLLNRGADRHAYNNDRKLPKDLTSIPELCNQLVLPFEQILKLTFLNNPNLRQTLTEIFAGQATFSANQVIDIIDLAQPSTENISKIVDASNCLQELETLFEYIISFVNSSDEIYEETRQQLKDIFEGAQVNHQLYQSYGLKQNTLSQDEFTKIARLMQRLPYIIRKEITGNSHPVLKAQEKDIPSVSVSNVRFFVRSKKRPQADNPENDSTQTKVPRLYFNESDCADSRATPH